MNAQIVERGPDGFTVAFTVRRGSDFPTYEAEIREAINEAGTLATAEALKQFDTDGEPVEHWGTRYTSKGMYPRQYQTPFGVADVERHLYQSPRGAPRSALWTTGPGSCSAPTPALARMIAAKYAEVGSPRVQQDLEMNHGRRLRAASSRASPSTSRRSPATSATRRGIASPTSRRPG